MITLIIIFKPINEKNEIGGEILCTFLFGYCIEGNIIIKGDGLCQFNQRQYILHAMNNFCEYLYVYCIFCLYSVVFS